MTSYRYRPPQELHILSLLAQTAGRRTTGCLRVTYDSQTWMLFLEQGKVLYASTTDPFGRLDRHLRRLSNRLPGLASPVRVQVRLLFEQTVSEISYLCKDYDAICWLVEQQYLTELQAGELIEALTKDVLETLLPLRYGSHDLVEETLLPEVPRFCRLDLRSLVEACQVKPNRLSVSLKPPTEAFSELSGNVPDIRRPQPQNGQRPNPVDSDSEHLPGVNGAGQPLSPPSVPRTTYKIACIDDSPTVLRAIEAFLDDTAFKVIRIDNPVSALMQIVRNKPDLVLLDVTMPTLDGYELCSLLRRHPSFKQTPIIMVTSNRSLLDRAKAKLVGASGYLTKPFTQPDLLKTMFKYLS